MSYSIYKITNIVNNKVYIGFTHDPKERWKNHINSHKTIRRPLYESMKKHGVENFKFEVIYESEDREHTLLVMEPYYINQYDSYNNGYNCNKGGADTNTDELRAMNSERMKLNNPMKVLRTNNGSFKKGHIQILTEEHKKKLSESKKGSNNHNFNNSKAAEPLNAKVVCEHCKKEMNKGNYARWHGSKCKENVN